MKATKLHNKILNLFLALFVFQFASIAQATCGSKNPIPVEESDEILQKLVESSKKTPGMMKTSLHESNVKILDHKFHRIDRSEERFQVYNSVGVVTANPFVNKPQSHGSAVLISQCGHVLTNRHVVNGIAEMKARKEADAKGQSIPATKKDFLTRDPKNLQTVFFSVGQSPCGSKDNFSEQSKSAEILDFGNSLASNDDWAVVKVQGPISVAPAILSRSSMPAGSFGVRVGFSGESVMKYGYDYPVAQVIQSLGVGDRGLIQGSDLHPPKGISGGGVFSPKTGKLIAISSDVEGNLVSVSTIMEEIEARNPDLAQELELAAKGICN